MTPTKLPVPTAFTRGGRRRDEEKSVESAVWLINHMCDQVGISDLRNTAVLDVGCGVKFTQAILSEGLPLKRYVGVDVYREMIEFLRTNVDDPRFEFLHMNTHNARYNPEGEPLQGDTEMPIEETFDLICLFSVFTHLAPHDYRAMLQVLRRHIKPDGRLFYSLYIDELTEKGHGLVDGRARLMARLPAERLEAAMKKDTRHRGPGTVETFLDMDPREPLKWAVYSERHARELIDGTGWEIISLSPPDEYIQHHFVCAPA